MKIKLENQLDESIMQQITGGTGATITINKEQSADEMVNYPTARVTCPICNSSASMDLTIFMHGDGMGHPGQKCTNPACNYCWSYGSSKITVE